MTRTTTRIRTTSRRPRSHDQGARGDRLRRRGPPGKLKFGFNTGADHETRVAFLAEAWRTAFGLETEQIGSEFSVFQDERRARRVRHRPQRLGRGLPARQQPARPVHLRWRQQRQPVVQPGLRRAARPGGAASRTRRSRKSCTSRHRGSCPTTRRTSRCASGSPRRSRSPTWSGLIVTPSDFQMPGDKFYETI